MLIFKPFFICFLESNVRHLTPQDPDAAHSVICLSQNCRDFDILLSIITPRILSKKYELQPFICFNNNVILK